MAKQVSSFPMNHSNMNYMFMVKFLKGEESKRSYLQLCTYTYIPVDVLHSEAETTYICVANKIQ